MSIKLSPVPDQQNKGGLLSALQPEPMARTLYPFCLDGEALILAL